VYTTTVNDVAELKQNAEDGCKLLCNTLGIFERVRQSFMRSAARCMEAQRQQLEHFVLQFVVTKIVGLICNVVISVL
jgi:hypothetical protein